MTTSRTRGRRSTPLSVQVVLLLILCVTAAQLVSGAVMLGSPPPQGPSFTVGVVADALAGRPTPAGAVPTLAARSDEAPPYDNWEDPREREQRLALARRLGAEPADVRVVRRTARDGGPPRGGSRGSPPDPDDFGRLPPTQAPATGAAGDDVIPGPFTAALRQPDGRWRLVAAQREGLLDPWQRRALLSLAGSGLLVAALGYLFARRLAAPIRAFAQAAERLGRDPRGPALALEGPAEVGVAARAFNEMQERLRRYVEDRTAMIGAIAHDLRTPLTRLAFRLEGAPEELRVKAARDIAEMEAMLAATLAFVLDASRPAARERLELRSLVESVADDLADTGSDAAVEPGPPVVVHGDPTALRRLVTNLVVNAASYGHRARARVRQEGGVAVVEVDDDGPGLLEAELERVMEPFYRVERSRSRATGGVGLGLAVVRTIAHAHGGDVVLRNRPEGGLRARVRLPL